MQDLSLPVFVLGLIIGSFLSAVTYRLPKGQSVVYGRSFCDWCKRKLKWYDNIPLFSYILLRGRCRSCGKKISPRYPVIELSTGLTFLALYLKYINCLDINALNNYGQFAGSICTIAHQLGGLGFPYLLFLASILIAIFVVDFEYRIILDSFVFLLFAVALFVLLLFPPSNIFLQIFSGFLASCFFLLLYAITKGRGMGLGDVKLALAAGIILSPTHTFFWLTASFIVGAIVGLILILLGKARFGKPIAFGPFLVFGFFLTVLSGEVFFKLLDVIFKI